MASTARVKEQQLNGSANSNGNEREQQQASEELPLTVRSMNQYVRAVEYAVRGPIVTRAAAIEKELADGVKKPFDSVIRCNIGDVHAMGQRPITFIRQVVALCTMPELLDDARFPADVKERARRLLASTRGSSVGAYSDSYGLDAVRRDIAAYITARDEADLSAYLASPQGAGAKPLRVPCDYQNVYLSVGASEGITTLLQVIDTGARGSGRRAGVMVPIPQYPLYSATNSLLNAFQVNYYLDEARNWGLSVEELERSLDEAVRGPQGAELEPRALIVINPGNPTGQVLSRADIEGVIRFARRRRLVILADEVYQQNIYAKGSKFHSFRSVLLSMGEEMARSVQLVSFFSISKGYMGECGMRGGYFELWNFPTDLRDQIYKFVSSKLCPPVPAQCAMDAVVNPPRPDEPSYATWKKEVDAMLSELAYKASLVENSLNKLEGFQCNVVQGAMYAFPQIRLPERFVQQAKAEGQEPDVKYCFRLLEETGICVVPGSGFGQKPGTFHFRTTILPPREKMEEMTQRIAQFHTRFMQEFS